jgi:hypothetical protein
MSVLTVGSGQQFTTIKAAVAASHDGDTIYVEAGTYTENSIVINTDINLVGVGGMVHMVGALVSKATLITNSDVSIDHFEFSGAKSYNFNGAGIRYQAGNLTVTNSYFHDNEDGILGGQSAVGVGSVTVDHSEFNHNGAGDGQSHNIYIGMVDEFVFTNNFSHDAVVGHEVKTRALHNTITGNRIADLNGTSSYAIDLPASGNGLIENNVIQQGPKSQNAVIIAFGEETKHEQWTDHNLVVRGNTIINQLANRHSTGVWNVGANPVEITGNHIYGVPRLTLGTSVQSGNDTLAAAPAIDTSHPWASSPWDNIVWGGAAANMLYGSGARDLFVGGGGNDTFVIQSGGKSDTIANFQGGAGVGDVVKLEGYAFTTFNGVKAAMSQHGSDVWLNLGHGETLTFQNMTVAGFAANDFQFSAHFSVSSASTVSPTVMSRPAPFTLPASGGYVGMGGTKYDNNIVGDDGNNRIVGNGGNDTMQGGLGNDQYIVDSADVVIEKPGEGIDTVLSTVASYTLTANVENLTLTATTAQKGVGNALNNLITGNAANDTIDGGAGNDIINAGVGANLLTGGLGNDMFVFKAVGAGSTITDFHVGEDLLDLRTMINNSGYKGVDPLSDHVMMVTPDGHGGSMISLDLTHSGTMHNLVDLQGVAPQTLYIGLDVLIH